MVLVWLFSSLLIKKSQLLMLFAWFSEGQGKSFSYVRMLGF